MANVTLDKTWVISENTGNSSYAEALYDLKETLKNSTFWTVVRSCGKVGGVTWTADTNDNWGTSSAVVNAASGSNHSWVVLQNNNISTGFQFCFDYNSATVSSGSIVISPSAGFTGGSTTVRPTATDEIVLLSVGRFAYTSTYNCMISLSNDGQCTRIFWFSNDVVCSFWNFEVPKSPPSWFSTPFVAGFISNTSESPVFTYTNFCSSSIGYLKTVVSGTTVTLSLGALGIGTTNFVGSSNLGYLSSYNGEWNLCPCYLVSITAAKPGLYGLLYDVYWGEGNLQDESGVFMPAGNKLALMSIARLFFGSDNNRHGGLI
jgi:hypothetical protein